MKKKTVSVLLAAAMVVSMLAGCGSAASTTASSSQAAASTVAASSAAASTAAASTAAVASTAAASTAASSAAAATEASIPKGTDAKGKTYAIVVKSAGNPYNEKMEEGFKEVIEANGGTCIAKEPDSATADAQVSVIQSLISQKVNSISIAANDENALQSALTAAMKAGIKVDCMDSKVNSKSRETFINQAGNQEVAQALMDAVYDISGGSGQFAILSATSQATNQNAWIAAMKSLMSSNSKYKSLELTEVAYGDDEPQKSTDQTQALLSKYPNLKVICAPTTVGISSAAKVLQDQKSKVKLTGLGLPSEMAEYIGSDATHSCPYMFLWNPVDLGKLAAYTSMALVNDKIKGAVNDKFTAGAMGDYTLTDAGDGGSQIILGAPFKFDPSNIAQWKSVY